MEKFKINKKIVEEELELKPEYLEKLKRIDKGGQGKKFNSIKELKKIIENSKDNEITKKDIKTKNIKSRKNTSGKIKASF